MMKKRTMLWQNSPGGSMLVGPRKLLAARAVCMGGLLVAGTVYAALSAGYISLGAPMAARKAYKPGKFHSDAARERIRAAQLVNRLQSCAMGEIDLTMTQIRAIEILLRKCLPNLVQTDISATSTQRYVVEVPPQLTVDQWTQKYTPLPPSNVQRKSP
jgi:hypothetical protein